MKLHKIRIYNNETVCASVAQSSNTFLQSILSGSTQLTMINHPRSSYFFFFWYFSLCFAQPSDNDPNLGRVTMTAWEQFSHFPKVFAFSHIHLEAFIVMTSSGSSQVAFLKNEISKRKVNRCCRKTGTKIY